MRVRGPHGVDPNSPYAQVVPARAHGSYGLLNPALLNHPLAYVQSLSDAFEGMALLDDCAILWEDGDGNTPSVGPALTATGSPSSGESTPWEIEGGEDVTAEEYDGSSYRSSATALDPSLTEDVVVVGVARAPRSSAASYSTLLSTRSGSSRDWVVLLRHDQRWIEGFTHGDTEESAVSPALLVPGGWFVFLFVVDRDGLLHSGVNGSAQSGDSCAAGSIASGLGIGLAGYPSGVLPMLAGGGIVSVAAMYGAGIADGWTADSYARFVDLTHRLTGLYPRQGSRGAYSRASAAAWQDAADRWHIASSGLPRAGDSGGLRVAPGRTNLCYRNVDPQATTGWSATGGSLSVVDDSTELEAADADAWGPNVLELVNASGSDQYLYGGATTGAVTAHSLSCLARLVAGSGVEIGFRDSSSGAWSKAGDVTDGYTARTVVHGATPPDTDVQLAIRVPDGCTIRVIAQQLEAGARATTPIPNWATAASAARAAEVLTTSHTPEDEQGSIEATVTPMGWSGGGGGTGRLIDRASAGGYLIYPSSGGTYRFFDSAGQLAAPATIADGVAETVRTRWVGSQRSITDGDGRVDGAYSGALRTFGAMTVSPSEKESAVCDLRVFRNGGG